MLEVVLEVLFTLIIICKVVNETLVEKVVILLSSAYMQMRNCT
jgi:hypothetical protein